MNIQFKYISCYSLTLLWGIHNNTVNQFKYISCYSLTNKILCLFCHLQLFKYISCYSLTIDGANVIGKPNNI